MFVKSNDGIVHLKSVIGTSGEFTLCGNAFDGDANNKFGDDTIDLNAWNDAPNEKYVTCPICIREIKNCKNVKSRSIKSL